MGCVTLRRAGSNLLSLIFLGGGWLRASNIWLLRVIQGSTFDPQAFRSPLPLRHAPRPSDRGSLLASRSTTAARRRPLRHPLPAPATTSLSPPPFLAAWGCAPSRRLPPLSLPPNHHRTTSLVRGGAVPLPLECRARARGRSGRTSTRARKPGNQGQGATTRCHGDLPLPA